MRSRFVYPSTDTLTLANGDALTVRRRLNMGEQRESFAACSTLVVPEDGSAPTRVADPLLVGRARVAAFLVDWRLADPDAPPLVGLDLAQRLAVLDHLEPEDFYEIKTAVDAHEARQAAARVAEKNGQAGEKNEPAISPSPFAVAGPLTLSGN